MGYKKDEIEAYKTIDSSYYVIDIDIDPQYKDILDNINTCIYGHLHGQASENAFEGEFNNVRYIMVSCDYTKFKLVRI